MNPMIRKELRQRMRERRGWLLPTLYLVALGAVICFTYSLVVSETRWMYREIQGAEVGVPVFLVAAYGQLALLLLLVPVFSAGAVTIEKEQRTLPSLLTTLLTTTDIWWGKFVASLLFMVLLLISAVPVLGLSFAFGGVGPFELMMVSLTTFIILASMSAVGLYCSCYFRRSVHSTAVAYIFVITLSAVTAIAAYFTTTHWERTTSGIAHDFAETPHWALAPLYANPFYFLTAAFFPLNRLYPYWVIPTLVFLAVGSIAAAMGLRHLARSGDQV